MNEDITGYVGLDVHQNSIAVAVAVAKTPRKPGERIKTDRRDVLAQARYLRADELTPIAIPDPRDEALCDLSRAREDAVRARLKARQQHKAMLLRHGHRYSGKSSWTAAHERYLAQVERLTVAMREQAAAWRFAPVVHALMTLRGIEFVAAVTLVA